MSETSSREYPADPQLWLGGQEFLWRQQADPDLRELLGELIDNVLDDKERWIINALFWEGKSLQEVADQLGFSEDGKKNKTLVIYYRNKALRKLKEALVEGQQVEAAAYD